MTAVTRPDPIERFRAALAASLGLDLDETKSPLLSELLQARVDRTGGDGDAYLSALEAGAGRDEIRALARALTVPETYFFRNVEQFRALAEVVLPARAAARAADRSLQILSLGCASGEEAYSAAMVVRDTLAEPGWDVSIVGVDVNPAVLEKAARGRYSAWAMRETPDADRHRWFRADGREFILDGAIRASVRFEERNLADADPHLWRRGAYDVIFFRNVLMYLTEHQVRIVIGRIARALRPGGYLFLGHAETLRGLTNDFHLHHTHGTFYYERKAEREVSAKRSPRSASGGGRVSLRQKDMPAADAWVGTIRRASERVAALTDARPAGAPPEAVMPSGDAQVALGLELLRRERFADARAVLDGIDPATGGAPDVLLLRACLLVQEGRFADAEAACGKLFDLDELNAGAHYVLALCREAADDGAAASYHHQVATYLDPGFSMPRLHLGFLARRGGEYATARRELAHALLLLQREDPSRVLLFGGGFGRHALMELCRTELQRCGGTP